MASLSNFEPLEEEIQEFLKNYKHKRATVYEPCTINNVKDCLIGLSEEMALQNINYMFNPYIDIDGGTLTTESLVKLINAVYTVLHHNKNHSEKTERLKESNYNLENTNKTLNTIIQDLKQKLNTEKCEAKACVASAQRISEQSDTIHGSLIETKAKLSQLTKQKTTKEKSLLNEITRLKMENENLRDKLRNRSGSFTPCADVCDSTLTQLRDKDRRQRSVIATLQENNRSLLEELLALKDHLILAGIEDIHINHSNNNNKSKSRK